MLHLHVASSKPSLWLGIACTITSTPCFSEMTSLKGEQERASVV